MKLARLRVIYRLKGCVLCRRYRQRDQGKNGAGPYQYINYKLIYLCNFPVVYSRPPL